MLTGQIPESPSIDAVTGLYARAFIEQQLGKEIYRAKRQNSSLSLAAIPLDEFAEITKRYGPSTTDAALKELRRLKKACRGSDFAVRLTNADFLLVLPECGCGEVKIVLNRLGSLEMVCLGRKVDLAYTTGWGGLSTGRPAVGFAQARHATASPVRERCERQLFFHTRTALNGPTFNIRKVRVWVQASQPPTKLPPSVLVFRDGHQEEVERYVVQGDSLYTSADYWSTGSWTRRIPIAELDVPASTKLNAARGGKFSVPTRPYEVVVRF